MELPSLYDLPLWVDAFVFVLLLSVAVEAGYRTGLRKRRASESAESFIQLSNAPLIFAVEDMVRALQN
jgi:hypothetical protein